MNHNVVIFELTEKSLVVDPGSIQFPVYQQIKDSAIKLARHVEKVAVTEENVKESKRLVAEVSKQVKSLNDERIKVKKQLLEPYEEFEEQVKEISIIVKTSEDIVRKQIRQLEEQERDQKEKEIEELFNKRMLQYDFENLFSFSDFIENKYLNKTYSLAKVEKAMILWFEKINQGLEAIRNLDYADEVLAEYKNFQDLSLAIGVVTERHEKQDKAKQVLKEAALENKLFRVSFVVTDEKNAKLVEMFMEQNKIKYEKVGK